jgi:hypothetical protein
MDGYTNIKQNNKLAIIGEPLDKRINGSICNSRVMSVSNMQNMHPQLELVMFARGLKPKGNKFYYDTKMQK